MIASMCARASGFLDLGVARAWPFSSGSAPSAPRCRPLSGQAQTHPVHILLQGELRSRRSFSVRQGRLMRSVLGRFTPLFELGLPPCNTRVHLLLPIGGQHLQTQLPSSSRTCSPGLRPWGTAHRTCSRGPVRRAAGPGEDRFAPRQGGRSTRPRSPPTTQLGTLQVGQCSRGEAELIVELPDGGVASR